MLVALIRIHLPRIIFRDVSYAVSTSSPEPLHNDVDA